MFPHASTATIMSVLPERKTSNFRSSYEIIFACLDCFGFFLRTFAISSRLAMHFAFHFFGLQVQKGNALLTVRVDSIIATRPRNLTRTARQTSVHVHQKRRFRSSIGERQLHGLPVRLFPFWLATLFSIYVPGCELFPITIGLSIPRSSSMDLRVGCVHGHRVDQFRPHQTQRTSAVLVLYTGEDSERLCSSQCFDNRSGPCDQIHRL